MLPAASSRAGLRVASVLRHHQGGHPQSAVSSRVAHSGRRGGGTVRLSHRMSVARHAKKRRIVADPQRTGVCRPLGSRHGVSAGSVKTYQERADLGRISILQTCAGGARVTSGGNQPAFGGNDEIHLPPQSPRTLRSFKKRGGKSPPRIPNCVARQRQPPGPSNQRQPPLGLTLPGSANGFRLAARRS